LRKRKGWGKPTEEEGVSMVSYYKDSRKNPISKGKGGLWEAGPPGGEIGRTYEGT